MSRTPARLAATALAAGAVLVATPALAHVSVSSTDAARDGYGKATFRVPNESDDASTTRLVVTLPSDTPFSFVTAQDKAGWDAEVTKEKLPEPVEKDGTTLTEAVTTVTWTADDGVGIAPGEFDEFAISGGPFPDAEQVTFAAEQTYDDGEVVTWDEVAEEGAAEPERPAPTLALAAATGDTAAAEPEGSGDWLARGLGLGALVLAAGAVLVSLREHRRRA